MAVVLANVALLIAGFLATNVNTLKASTPLRAPIVRRLLMYTSQRQHLSVRNDRTQRSQRRDFISQNVEETNTQWIQEDGENTNGSQYV